MKRYFSLLFTAVFSVLLLQQCFTISYNKQNIPGRYKTFTLLPNGWKLTPAGEQAQVGELPLNMLVSKDEKYAITTNNGAGPASLSVVDLADFKEVQRFPLHNAWRGLAWNSKGDQLFVSAGNDDAVLIFPFTAGRLSTPDTLYLKHGGKRGKISVSGLAFWERANKLLAVSRNSGRLYLTDPDQKKVLDSLDMGGKCYDVQINHEQDKAYVSVWGKGLVREINLDTFKTGAVFRTGSHPCELLLSRDDSRLFAANANHNSTSAVDLILGKTVETIISSLSGDKPYGSTPNALAFNEDESVLIIANADNNNLALFDIADRSQSRSMGFIPTGWYPDAVKFLKKTNQILTANGKGLASRSNPKGPTIGYKTENKYGQYIGELFKGALSKIDFPNTEVLAEYSRQVYQNTPYLSRGSGWKGQQYIIPDAHNGMRSEKIKHVFYIIRENRTYDQVLGDLSQGNGDSSLCLFPREITPNAHALAEQFTLFDNFYADAEVSADGHNWSVAAYASDYVEKTWPELYGKRGGSYDYEGGTPIAAPASGYIWDGILKKGLGFRNYGEYAWHDKEHPGFYRANDAYLRPYTSTTFPCFDLKITDVRRYEIWKEEFDKYVADDALPEFILMRLPNDHNAGTKKGRPTVKAMTADNDYALGLIVEAISKSPYWDSSLILVLEDDAQNGSDHVDAHRSILLAAGPYVKHGFVDHTLYSSSSVLKTIELVFGLQPMTQFDLSATPLLPAISDRPVQKAFSALLPEVDLNELNDGSGYRAARCEEMDLTREDAIPDIEFNEITWKAMRGADSEMPPPVRSAFVLIND